MTPTSPMPEIATLRRPRRWLRFSLRLLLVSVTLLCIGLGWWTHRARQQRGIVERIEAGGGYVLHGSLFDSRTGKPREYTVPARLIEPLGIDFFYSVTEVGTADTSVLPELSRLGHLESLVVGGKNLSDDDLAPLGRLRSLQSLLVTMGDNETPLPPVGDETMAVIAKLPRLESAWINGSRITPQGIESLARSRSLRRVSIACSNQAVDASVAEPFRRAGRVSYLVIQNFTPSGMETVSKWDTEQAVATSP